MSSSVFDNHYSEMSSDELLKSSRNPSNLNINGLPSLIKELDKRGHIEQKESVSKYYLEQTTIDINETPDKLSLNGWMTILLIGLFARLIQSGFLIYNDLIPLMDSAIIIDDSLNSSFKNDIYQIMAIQAFSIIMSIVLIYLMLSFKRSFPKIMIAFILISLLLSVYSGTDFFQSWIEDNDKILLIGQSLFGLVWIFYLTFSNYIKKNFIKA